MSVAAWPFIEFDEAGRPTIQGRGLRVLQLAREHITFDWNADQLQRQHPHLSLAEIHAALGYYYDHRTECDADLQEEEQRLELLKQQLVNPGLQEQLRRTRNKA